MAVDDLRAAPPDDGGHRSSYTRPGDELCVGGTEKSPQLHWDTTHGRSPWRMTWEMAVVVVAIVVVGVLLGLPYAP